MQATLHVVGEFGVHGASTARIAAAVGVSEAALYRHFKSRDEMILAAVDAWYDRVAELHANAADDNALEWLRRLGRNHVQSFSAKGADLAPPFLAFAASEPGAGFRERVEKRQYEATMDIARIIEIGQRQSTIRADVSATEAAWQLVGVFWANVVARAIGTAQFANDQRTASMIDLVLERISAPATPPNSSPN